MSSTISIEFLPSARNMALNSAFKLTAELVMPIKECQKYEEDFEAIEE